MCAESDGNPEQDLEALVALHERMDILSEVRFNHSRDSTDILPCRFLTFLHIVFCRLQTLKSIWVSCLPEI